MRAGAVQRLVPLFVILVAQASRLLRAAEAAADAPARPEMASQFSWQHWNRDHGLPDNRIPAIRQTQNGYLWAATALGLARFDGRHWEVFNRANTPQLETQDFRGWAENADGELWLGFKHGLFRWNGQTFARYALRDDVDDGVAAPIYASPSGDVWVAAGAGLWRLQRGAKPTCFGSITLGAADLTEIREVAGQLWLASTAGIIRFDPHTGVCDPDDVELLRPRRYVQGFDVDDDGGVWALCDHGSPQTVELARVVSGNLESNPSLVFSTGARPPFLFRDREGTVWLPGGQGGVSCLRAGQRFDLRLPPPADQDFVLSVCDDHEGGVWLGTESSGLLRCQRLRVQRLAGPEGLTNSAVWTICEARDGSVWVGTDGGVSRFRKGEVTHFTERDGLSRNAVRSIVEDQDGRIWIGTGSGLNWISDERVRQHQFPGEWFSSKIRALVAGRDRSLWVGTAKGLFKLRLLDSKAVASERDDGTNASPPFTVNAIYGLTNGLRSHDIRALLEDSAGDLWVGTAGGGLHRLRDGNCESSPELDEHCGKSVWALHEDASGTLWIGSDRGLTRFKENHAVLFTSRNGLPDDSINHVLEDNCGQLWLGGERGIHRLAKQELDAIADGRASTARCVTYDEDDGLLTRETNGQKNQPGAIKSSDGRLWFSTAKGVAIFDPRRLPDQTNAPSVVIERVHASGKILFDNQPGGSDLATNGPASPRALEASLAAGDGRIVEIHFTACTFVAADELRFTYRLFGLENEWTDAGTRRVAQYANLAPGRYRFQVLAANKYHIRNETGASFTFSLLPFFWQTWWFKTLCVVGPVLGGMGFYRMRLRQHRRAAETQRAAAVANERAEIARDLHDYLGPRITVVQHLSATLNTSAATPGSEVAQQRLTRLANELNASLDSAVWAVQPDKDTLVSLTDYLGDSFHEFLAGTHVELELDFPDSVPAWLLSRSERYHLALAAIEALNNVLKHSGATRVYLRLEVGADSFQLRIADNGRGFDPGKSLSRSGGNGIVNMQHRMARLGGDFQVSSQPGKGTAIVITLSPAARRLTRKTRDGPKGDQPCRQ